MGRAHVEIFWMVRLLNCTYLHNTLRRKMAAIFLFLTLKSIVAATMSVFVGATSLKFDGALPRNCHGVLRLSFDIVYAYFLLGACLNRVLVLHDVHGTLVRVKSLRGCKKSRRWY